MNDIAYAAACTDRSCDAPYGLNEHRRRVRARRSNRASMNGSPERFIRCNTQAGSRHRMTVYLQDQRLARAHPRICPHTERTLFANLLGL